MFLPAEAEAHSYVFTLSSPASVDLDVVQRSGAADLVIQLADQRGTEVLFVDPQGLDDPVVRGEVLDRGTYLLIVSNAVQAAAGSYDLTITMQP